MKKVWHRWSADWASPGAVSTPTVTSGPTGWRDIKPSWSPCPVPTPSAGYQSRNESVVNIRVQTGEKLSNSNFCRIFSFEEVLLSALVAPEFFLVADKDVVNISTDDLLCTLPYFFEPGYQKFSSTGCQLCYNWRSPSQSVEMWFV